MARRPSTQPTDVELEILQTLWDAGPLELGALCARLQQSRPVATTTVATMLKVMLEKGLVRRSPGRRASLWSAALTRHAAARGMIGKLIDRVFDGSAARLVAHLIQQGKLTPQERDEIRRLLASQHHPKTRRRSSP